jgi:hypothetical protein
MANQTTQERYASNLSSVALGTALYRPVEFRTHSGRVGDIAFVDKMGIFQWIANAFHTEVSPSSSKLILQDLLQWNWPTLAISDPVAVDQSTCGHFKMAVGGRFKMDSHSIGLQGGGPVPPVPG